MLEKLWDPGVMPLEGRGNWDPWLKAATRGVNSLVQLACPRGDQSGLRRLKKVFRPCNAGADPWKPGQAVLKGQGQGLWVGAGSVSAELGKTGKEAHLKGIWSLVSDV